MDHRVGKERALVIELLEMRHGACRRQLSGMMGRRVWPVFLAYSLRVQLCEWMLTTGVNEEQPSLHLACQLGNSTPLHPVGSRRYTPVTPFARPGPLTEEVCSSCTTAKMCMARIVYPCAPGGWLESAIQRTTGGDKKVRVETGAFLALPILHAPQSHRNLLALHRKVSTRLQAVFAS